MPTVVELKKMCKHKGIKGYSKMKKTELLRKVDLHNKKSKGKNKKYIMPTVVELKKMCKHKGIKGYSKMKKTELLRKVDLHNKKTKAKLSKGKNKKGGTYQQNIDIYYYFGNNKKLANAAARKAQHYNVFWETSKDHNWAVETYSPIINGEKIETMNNESRLIIDYLKQINNIDGIGSAFGSQPGVYMSNFTTTWGEIKPDYMQIPYIHINIDEWQTDNINQFITNLETGNRGESIVYNIENYSDNNSKEKVIQISVNTKNLSPDNEDLLNLIFDQGSFWQIVVHALRVFK